MRHQAIRLYGSKKRRQTWLGGAVLGLLLGAVPAFLPAIFVRQAWGPATAVIVSLLTLLPIIGAVIKVVGKLNPELHLGADGISLRGGTTSATRFIPFDRLDTVEVTTYRFVRETHLGLRVTHAGGTETLGEFESAADAERVAEEVQEAKARWASTRSHAVGRAALESAGAPVSAWLEALRERSKADADFRSAILDRDQLLELVEDGTAKVEHRVGAAVLLAEKECAAAREPIRIAAEASANPKLRIALSSIAQDDIDESAIEVAIAEERVAARVRPSGAR